MLHTKGPWRYEKATQTIRSMPENYWLATMDSFEGAVTHEANARLIASAPELLEALEAAVAQLEADHDSEVAAEMFGGEPDPARAMAINRHDVADMARNAITKAKESP